MTGTRPQEARTGTEVVLFTINDDYFSDFALRLAARGVQINAIMTNVPDRFRQQLPRTELIDSMRLYNPDSILALNQDDEGCLSAADVERFGHVENLYLNITDRLSYYPTTVRFRVQLFRALLRYWIRFFSERPQVGTTFHISAPHMGPDLVAFHVAKSFGVRTLFLERTLITNRVLLLEDYAAVDRVPATFLAGETRESIERHVQPDLLRELHAPSPWAKYSATINKNIVANRNERRVSLAGVFSRQLPAKLGAAARKLRGNVDLSNFFLQGKISGYQVEVARVQYGRRVKRLRELYQGLATAPQGKPYVLFALHLQPERSTCPQGGVYDDQLLAIETAAKALPAGYELYVKEHPRQFSPKFIKSRHYRDEEFYRRLAALPNVRLMGIETDAKELGRDALMTATTTGSAGWESLVAGKPCLAFGTPWYAGCRSCYIVRSLEDCRAAFTAGLAATKAEVERDVLVFLAFIQERLIYSSNGTLFARGAADYDTLVDNLTAAMAQRVTPRQPATQPSSALTP